MNKTNSVRTAMLAVTIAAFGLTGCATTGAGIGGETGRNAAIGAGVGALAGAAIGRDVKGAAIGAGVGALGGYVWSQHMQQKKLAMERATAGTGVAVVQTQDNQLKLNIPSDVSFDTGRSDIKANLRPVLDQFANGLANQPNTEVRVVGHTDSTGGTDLNNRLSLDRAESTRQYLLARGVDPRRVTIAGRGEAEPVADNTSDAGRARNRRVEIFLGERSNVAAR
jgi:outer membrane protein OmpA-like peptidoglycan-associated protein